MTTRKAFSLVLFGGGARSAFLIIQGFVIARYLGVDSYGVFSIALAYIATVFGLIDFRISEAVIKFVADFKRKGQENELFTLSFLFLLIEGLKGLIAAAVILTITKVVTEEIYAAPELLDIILALSLYNFFMTLNPTLTAFLRLGAHYKAIAYYDFLFGLTSLLLNGGVVIATGSIEYLVISYALTGFIGGTSKCILVWWVHNVPNAFRVLTELRDWRALQIPWKKISSFCLDINLMSSARLITKNIDVLLLGKFVDAEDVGVYSLAKKVKGLFAYVTDPLLIIIYPEYAKEVAAGNLKKLRKNFWKVSRVSILAVAFLSIVIGLLSIWVLPTVFGEGYADSVYVLWIFVFEVLFSVGLFSIYHLFLSFGESRALIKSALINLLISVMLLPVLIYTHGIYGAAAGCVIAVMVSHIYLLRKQRSIWND